MNATSDSTTLIRLFVSKGYKILNGQVISPRGKIRKLGKSKGYPTVTMKVPKSRRVIPIHIHKIVAYMKFGDEVFYYTDIRHLNGNRMDFSENNLVLGSKVENAMDRPTEDRKAHSERAWKSMSKYDENTHQIIIAHQQSGLGYTRISKLTGIPQSSVRAILKRFSGTGNA